MPGNKTLCSSFPKIILASQSPRRREILSSLKIPFRIVYPRIDEAETDIFHQRIPFINAVKKAELVAVEFPLELVLGADTVIEFQGKTVGKPWNKNKAIEMLEMLSGKKHLVITAACIINISESIRCIFSDTTRIQFKKFKRKTITEYLKRVNPLDKAGAYAIQEYGEMLIEKIEGSKDNVAGLPSEKLLMALRSCGYSAQTVKASR